MAKIRNGFVSNSSSSSFIIGIAKVTDLAACVKSIKGLDEYDFQIWEVTGEGDLEVTSFMHDEVSLSWAQVALGDHVLRIDYTGNEGDHCFQHGEWGDINYDINIETLVPHIFEAIDNIKGIGNLEIATGAGRNG